MGALSPSGARSPAEAVANFLEIHQQAVSCVTLAVLAGQVYYPTSASATMNLGENGARLGRRHRLALVVRHGYRFVKPGAGREVWRIATSMYAYRLQDLEERLVRSYHWHPIGLSPVAFPHLHVGGRTAPVDLGKAHLPTGPVTLPAVIRMTIAELGVEPLRADWDNVLAEAELVLAS